MTAGVLNLEVEQGATFTRVITWTDENAALINLVGYTAAMKARVNFDSTSAFIDLTTENGGITLGGAAGTIQLDIDAATTAALATLSGVYDLELYSGAGVKTRLLKGTLTVSREVTK